MSATTKEQSVHAARTTAAPQLTAIPSVRTLIDLALEEDLGRGDITTAAVIGADSPTVRASLVARERLVVFGVDIAVAVFTRLDARVRCEVLFGDGALVDKGTAILLVHGPADAILSAERTALNFMQRLSGVATQSRRYAEAVKGTEARVVDTRKTTPGYRVLEKAAVRAGGCGNHRFDLGSGVLIKDNHIAASASVTAAVTAARLGAPHSLRIEVEVENFEDLAEALEAKADVVLLDNMSPADVARGAALAHEYGALVEVSGGITLANVADYAHAGADLISVGALTHSAPAVDLALDIIS